MITRDHGRAAKYLRYLEKELALQLAHFSGDRRITQLHWGGGTPTFLSHAEMAALMAMLRDHFEFAPDGEYAIEVDPRTADGATPLNGTWAATGRACSSLSFRLIAGNSSGVWQRPVRPRWRNA